MSDHQYTRPTIPAGRLISTTDTDSAGKTLNKLTEENLSGKAFVLKMSGANMTFSFTDTLTGAEITTLDGIVSGFTPVDPKIKKEWKYELTERSAGKVSGIKRYATDNGDGTYADLVEEVIYTYQASKLISEEQKVYYTDGSLESSQKWNYFTTPTGDYVKKPE